MAKRTYFIENDFKAFFEKPDWEKYLKTKVDYQLTSIYKDKYTQETRTFCGGLLSYQILQNLSTNTLKQKFEEIFKVLDSKGYIYTEKDLMICNLGANVDDADAKAFIYLLETMAAKGIDLTQHKGTIYQHFGNIHHYDFDNYLIDKDLLNPAVISHMMYHHLGSIADYNEYQALGILSFSTPAERQMEKAVHDNAVRFLTDRINNINTDEEILKNILNHIYADKTLFSQYLHKNKLEVNAFAELEYFKTLPYKPKELFSKEMLKIIENLEKRLNLQYLDRSGKTPQELFKEATKENKEMFNAPLILQYQDGSEITLEHKVKFKK